MLGGGSIAGITFGHVAGGGGVCVFGVGGTLGWGLMVRARIQGFWEIAQWGRGLLGRLLLRSVEGKSG